MFDENKLRERLIPAVSGMYADTEAAVERYISAVRRFFSLYGETDDFSVFPLREEAKSAGIIPTITTGRSLPLQ